jgi:hypothetical protein
MSSKILPQDAEILFIPDQQPPTLDYIFTDIENVVEHLVYNVNAPVEKNDHVTLEGSFLLTAREQVKLSFWKRDYGKIDEALQRIDWRQAFDGKLAAEM